MIEGTAEMDFSYMFGWEMIGVVLVAANMARSQILGLKEYVELPPGL